MARLAIKGHATRGKEVIEILEMLGGKIRRGRFVGHEISCAYYINEDGYMSFKHYSQFDDTMIFTLEEFLEKFPYKVGDRVKNARINDFIGRITNVRWDCNENQIIYVVEWNDATKSTLPYFARDLQPYKEDIVEERNNDSWAKWDLPDGYEFQDKEGNVINTDIIKLVKKQPQYPKTYVECAKMLDCFGAAHIDGYKGELLEKLQELIVCRDAYWKIAGEQMGLGKPWEPNWLNTEQDKFVLYTHDDVICLNRFVLCHNVLAFPTAEMRDAFYENFKDLIEECKEFL